MGIKLIAPEGLAEAHGLSGNHYKADENGIIDVTETTDIVPFLNAGFIHAQPAR